MFDQRSYRLDSSKLLNTNFNRKFSVEIAIQQLKDAILNNSIKFDESTYTVSWMKKNDFN